MENQYRVIFDIGGNAGRSSAIAGQSTQQSEIKDLRHQQTAISSVKSLIASDLKGIGNRVLDNYINTVEIDTGSHRRQLELQTAYQSAQWLVGTTESALTMGATFSTFGMSAGAGILTSLLLSVVNVGVGFILKSRTDTLNMRNETAELGVARERSGVYYNRSRRGL